MVSSIVPVSSPSVIPENPSPQVVAVLQWIAAFNRWDMRAVADTLSDEGYEHIILPLSLKVPSRNKQQWLDNFEREYKPMFTNFAVTVHQITDTHTRVVVHASSTAESATGHPYNNEYMLTYHLAEDAYGNQKIYRVEEFVDSGNSALFFQGERQRMAARSRAA